MFLFPVSDSDVFHWKGYIIGPPETPFEKGVFELDIVVPKNYPLRPPKIKFITKVFHPNIHFKTGEICLDLLKNAWSAVYTLQSVCRSIIALLAHPEPDSPLNCDCGELPTFSQTEALSKFVLLEGNLLRNGDDRGYNSLAKMYTKLFASSPPPPLPK